MCSGLTMNTYMVTPLGVLAGVVHRCPLGLWGHAPLSLPVVIVKAEESRPARWGCAHGACGVWAPPGPAGRDVP